ncbi:hypothetical protein HYU10_02215 [Candidatus Woesearchaeota archaeon]|nr:hypothetical protein [Candidatus Woesearchaeota archaeon]
MADEQKTQTQQQKKKFIAHWRDKGFTEAWNISWFGERLGKFPHETQERVEELHPVLTDFEGEFILNKSMITQLKEIEDKWGFIETAVFPYVGGMELDNVTYDSTPKSNTITDLYRKIDYFRDAEVLSQEIHLLETTGTVGINVENVEFDRNILLERARNSIRALRDKIDAGRGEEVEQGEQKTVNERYSDVLEYMRRLEQGENRIAIRRLVPREFSLPFLDGREEKVVLFGVKNAEDNIAAAFNRLSIDLDNFGSICNVPAGARTPITRMVNAITQCLTGGTNIRGIKVIERDHFEHLEHGILPALQTIKDVETNVEQFSPPKDLIRFPHSYKIIKPFILRNGQAVYFKTEFPNFNRGDEIEPGLDENGWPLEVDPKTGEVLLDLWWYELSENDWHEFIVKKKDLKNGTEVWNNKVEMGIRRYNANSTRKAGRLGTAYIRKIPKEFIGDVDPLDKIMFIYNEWDSFRDDYRDGRFHPHSKTCMDYIMAGTGHDHITPLKKINLSINTENKSSRIKFKPLYYSELEEEKDRNGIITGHRYGDLREEYANRIPDDEKKVTRLYSMQKFNPATRNWEVEKSARKPGHLNPAFDRTALGSKSKFIHWGRMYYYETPDGINKYSENPFPHIATRGIAKYLIDLAIRRTFSFEGARTALKSNNQEYDYGVRHWGEPFITDPLGEVYINPAKGQPGRGPGAGAL